MLSRPPLPSSGEIYFLRHFSVPQSHEILRNCFRNVLQLLPSNRMPGSRAQSFLLPHCSSGRYAFISNANSKPINWDECVRDLQQCCFINFDYMEFGIDVGACRRDAYEKLWCGANIWPIFIITNQHQISRHRLAPAMWIIFGKRGKWISRSTHDGTRESLFFLPLLLNRFRSSQVFYWFVNLNLFQLSMALEFSFSPQCLG